MTDNDRRQERAGRRGAHAIKLRKKAAKAEGAVRIIGSRNNPPRTLAAAGSVKSAAGGVPSFIPGWRRERPP